MNIFWLGKRMSSLVTKTTLVFATPFWAQEVTDELLTEFEQDFQAMMQTFNRQ